MLEPAKSLQRQVTYNAGDPQVQWRCHLHLLHRPVNFYFVIAFATALVFGGKLSAVYIIPFSFAIIALVAAKTAIMIALRTRGESICTATINNVGFSEQTGRTTTVYRWPMVRKILISDGDVYFYIPYGGSFVPSSAFANQAEAANFLLQATALWHAELNKSSRSALNKHDGSDK